MHVSYLSQLSRRTALASFAFVFSSGRDGWATSKLMNLWPQRRLFSSANFSLTASLASVRRSSRATLGVTSIPVVPASVQREDAPGVLGSVHACSFVFASCIIVQFCVNLPAFCNTGTNADRLIAVVATLNYLARASLLWLIAS